MAGYSFERISVRPPSSGRGTIMRIIVTVFEKLPEPSILVIP
jgi:hypothetical protein